MPRNFRLSHTWADSTYEDRRIAELARGPLHSPKHPLTAELGRNSYGGFFACLRGWGYPTVRQLPHFETQPREAEDELDALVALGYALADPENLIEFFDIFPEERMSVADLDGDSAGYPVL